MKLLKLHITLVLLVVWSFVFSQQHTNYSLKDGLPSNHVYRITQDYDGFIWIITDKGMSKFDGKTFKNFTIKDGLPSNDIWQIRITPDNKIWFFSKTNKLGYIENDIVYSFPLDRNEIFFPRIILQSGNQIAMDDGEYFYSLKDSVWVSQKNEFSSDSTYLKQKVLHPNIDHQGIGGIDDYFYVLSINEKKTKYFNVNSLKTLTEYGQVNDSLYMFINKEDYFFVNLNTEKLSKVLNSSQEFSGDFKYLRYHQVNNEVQLTGLNFVCYLGEDLRFKGLKSVPQSLDAHFSFIDKTGNIWSATFNKGIYVLPKAKENVKFLLKNKEVQQLSLIDSTLYAGIFNEGYFKITDRLQPFVVNDRFQFGISNVSELKSIFFSSRKGLFRFKNNQIKELDVLQKPNKLNDLARKLVFHKGYLYGNNTFGINKINSENFEVIKELQFYGVTSFSKIKNRLFIGSLSGLRELKNDTIKKLPARMLFDKPVMSLVNYLDTLLVAGTEGAGAYVSNGDSTYVINNTDELSVQNIFVDVKNDIWLATNNGVLKVIKTEEGYTAVSSFYEADGLLSNNTNGVAIKKDSLYVSTGLGISVIGLNNERVNQLQDVYIKEIFINGKATKSSGLSIPYASNNYVSFSAGVIDFSDQINLKYAYKLNPINEEWISTNSQEINFTNLKPQKYILDLKVTNHQHFSVYKTITFEITPLWYQTFWFKVVVFVCCVLFLYGSFKVSKTRIQKKIIIQEKAKQKAIYHELHALRSQMNPHFVFNSLNAVQYYMNNNEIELSEKYLVKFSRLIRMFFDFSREQFISIDQEVKLLKAYLEIEKMRFGDDFKFHFNIDPQLNKDIKIPSMLLQPIVENAVNHGLFHLEVNGEVEIVFKKLQSNDDFSVCIKDNGVGFKRAKEIKAKSIKTHTSKSSEIILDRLHLINNSGHWNIVQAITDLTTETSSGTSVLLTFNKKQHD